MADTLIDEPPPRAPPPITLHDAVPPPRRGRAVAILVAVLTAILLVGGVAFYLFAWRYEPVARHHIPPGATLAVRLELADVFLYKPVRQNLWPLLVRPDEGQAGKSRNDRIHEETGLSPATDLREAVIASTDLTSWVLLLGGRVPRGRFVSGLAKIAREDGWVGFREQGELLVGPGVAVGQADDGTLIIGTGVGIVNAALVPSDEDKKMGLPDGATVTFAIDQRAWRGDSDLVRAIGPDLLSHVTRATGRFTLGDAPEVTAIVEPAAGIDARHLATEIEGALSTLRLLTLLLPDVAGEQGALRVARVAVSGEQVALGAPWPTEGLDRGCARLAMLIRLAQGR